MIYFERKSMEEKIRQEKYYEDRISRTWSLAIKAWPKNSGQTWLLNVAAIEIKSLGYDLGMERGYQ